MSSYNIIFVIVFIIISFFHSIAGYVKFLNILNKCNYKKFSTVDDYINRVKEILPNVSKISIFKVAVMLNEKDHELVSKVPWDFVLFFTLYVNAKPKLD